MLSAFFSSSETALISASRIKLEVWVRHGVRGAKQATAFIKHPEGFLTTILVGNNIAIVAASSILAVHLEEYLSGFAITAVSSILLLFFGEILPKSAARDKANTFTLRISILLKFFYILLYPFIWSVMLISRLFLSLLGLERGSLKQFFTRKDLEMLAREGEESGLIGKEEGRLISRLILRGNQKIRDIMIPRTDIVSVTQNATALQAANLFIKTGYSRLPVIGENIDKVLGLITAKDILLKKPRSIKPVIREILYVPELGSVADLLREFRTKSVGMAIVVDEYGGTAGLVTLEDVIEEFFGEIQDEFDEDVSLYRKISPKQIDVSARVEIEELNQRFQLQLPKKEYQTLGGFIIGHLGHIPKRGERIQTDTCTLIILSAYRKKINWVRILRNQ